MSNLHTVTETLGTVIMATTCSCSIGEQHEKPTPTTLLVDKD